MLTCLIFPPLHWLWPGVGRCLPAGPCPSPSGFHLVHLRSLGQSAIAPKSTGPQQLKLLSLCPVPAFSLASDPVRATAQPSTCRLGHGKSSSSVQGYLPELAFPSREQTRSTTSSRDVVGANSQDGGNGSMTLTPAQLRYIEKLCKKAAQLIPT